MNIKKKREAGETLGREGIANRVKFITSKINEATTYQEVMELAGRISTLVDAASYDSYWNEKVSTGKFKECGKLATIVANPKLIDQLVKSV